MFFALTDEQRALAETVRDYLADRFDLTAVRAVFEDPDSDGNPARLWKDVGAAGWLAVTVPERYDGLGLGLLDAQVIARAFGAGIVPGPWLTTVLAGEAVRLAGSPEQAGRILPALAAGQTVATVALRATGASYGVNGLGSSGGGIGVRATADGLLTGGASPVEYPRLAETVVVAAVEPGGEIGLYLVQPGSAGVEVTAKASYDGTTRLGEVALHGAVGERLPGSSAAVFADLVDRGALLTAADLVGLSREALSRTVDYDKTRTQFGRPVGSFQAIKHHLADLHVAVTMTEHAVLYAAHAIDEGLAGAPLAVSVAKSKAAGTAHDVTAAMIQYHGGIGYTWEHEAHLFYKRAKRECYAYGDAASHRERVASLTVDAVTR